MNIRESTRKQTYILTACLLVLCAASLAAAQTGVSGDWKLERETAEDENLPSFSIRIKSSSGKASGHLYFVNATGESEAGGIAIPFIGTIKGSVVNIEFDSNRATSGDAQNFKYKRPTNKSPSLARLTLKKGKLEWRQTAGSLGANMPETFTLVRLKSEK